jgi:hypothetical protein
MKTKIKTAIAICALGLAIELSTAAQAAKPTAPSDLMTTAVSSDQINLTWTDNSNNETGFKIGRSTDGVNWALIARTAANVVNFSDAGLTPNTRYFYRVRAWNTSGNSAYTIPASAVTFDLKVVEAVRLNGANPIITESMFAAFGSTTDGANIDGPSIIRVPDWISPSNRPAATANYYLYFANHEGTYIRMAWAAELEGPWTLFNVGKNNTESVGQGVLDLNLGGNNTISIGNGIVIKSHVASPDVHVDDINQQIVMYFHCRVDVNGTKLNQKSLVATSADGLNFNMPVEGGQPGHGIMPVILGESYFRVFSYAGGLYALSGGGNVYQAPNATEPWSPPAGFDFRNELWTRFGSQSPFQRDLDSAGLRRLAVRHTAVRVVGDTLEVFYTRKGDAPERVFYSTIDLSVGSPAKWDPTYPPVEILRPEEIWEGVNDPLTASIDGMAPENVNQLRDPALYEENGQLYLFYTGRGEDAIGLVRLDPSN